MPERPLAEALAKGTRKMGKVTALDDAAMFIGRMENGVLANLEATRLRAGPQKSHRDRNQRQQRLAVF